MPVELGWQPSFGPQQLIGHYKIGVDVDTSRYPLLSGNGATSGRRMYYLLLDQMLWRTGRADTDGLIAFAGVVHADAAVTPLANHVFGGVVTTAAALGRPQDTIGLEASWLALSSALTAAAPIDLSLGLPAAVGQGAAPGRLAHETILEWIYVAFIWQGVALSPDVQYVRHPGATGHTPDALVLGLRSSVQF